MAVGKHPNYGGEGATYSMLYGRIYHFINIEKAFDIPIENS